MPFFVSSYPATTASAVFLGGSITDGSGASVREQTSWRALTRKWLGERFLAYDFTSYNSGAGGTGSWVGLTRLQADVIDKSPTLIFVDFAVNDTGDDERGSRAGGFGPAAEALIRRLRTDAPNAQIIPIVFTWPEDYSVLSYTASRDKWAALAAHYGLACYRWDQYLETLMGAGYDDTDVDAYLSAHGNVHPNDAGHAAAAALIQASLTALGNTAPALPARLYDCADFEATPQLINGTSLTTTGTWSTSGTAIISSTAGSTASWTGTCCSWGIDNNDAASGVIEWQVDGGAWTSYTLATNDYALTNFTAGAHTLAVRVVSGTVRINRLLAI